MAAYFTYVPNLEYINRTSNSTTSIDRFIKTKNLFKRVKLRDDIFGNLSFFEKYSIIGDERPDSVAYGFYGDEVLDWVVLLSNNIISVQSEWPLSQRAFDEYLFEKYGSGVENRDEVYNIIYNGVHHWETIETKDSSGIVQLKEGIVFNIPLYSSVGIITNPVLPRFELKYFDSNEQVKNVTKSGSQIFKKVTNYEYEVRIEEKKRNIFLLKPQYLNIIINDIETVMPYVEGSTQFVSSFLKRVDDVRLYQ